MKKEHLILGAIAIVGGYFAYKHFKKEEKVELPKETEEAETSNFSGRGIPKTAKTCTCKNGLTATCYSGDCTACCGKYGYEGKKGGFTPEALRREAPYKRAEIIPQF